MSGASQRRDSQIIPNDAARAIEAPLFDREGPFEQVIEALSRASERGLGGKLRSVLPSRSAVAAIVDELRSVLFPSHFEAGDWSGDGLRHRIGTRLYEIARNLREQVKRGLAFACKHGARSNRCALCDLQAEELTALFVARLPQIRALLETDIQAAFEGDPAARSPDETLFCYPGVTAVIQHRIAHELFQLSVPLIPRIISELAHGATGIDIHPGAQIGGSFFIDHGTGVVIGETCSIGERVRIYQGVTLGARSFESDAEGHLIKGLPRHPIVEDDVVIYAGATILGRITIGKGATIGGNVWLTRSVPPHRVVTQARARQDSFENGSGI
ncbi:MAG TPA: serine O-acetyltransferase EpsC [Polyangiaceae bacterium]|nr:serine O-acetyltransferase EpsC [Polyangiaceae bacterium]